MGRLEGEEPLEPVATADDDFGDLPMPITDIMEVFAADAPGSSKGDQLGDRPEHPPVPIALSEDEQERLAREDPEVLVVFDDTPPMANTQGVVETAEHTQPKVHAIENDKVSQVTEGTTSPRVQHVQISVSTEVYVVEEEEEEVDHDSKRARSVLSDGLDVATHRGETPAATDYHIIEETTDDEDNTQRARSEFDDGVEVATDRGETPAVSVAFSVEEAVTEGRRTEVSAALDSDVRN
jgi:hypothetical protein